MFGPGSRRGILVALAAMAPLLPVFASAQPFGATPDWELDGDQADASWGWATASAGDVNGDGYDDLVVGAPFYDDPEVDEGKVFVYYGSPTGPSLTPDWSWSNDRAGSGVGYSVAAAGDVNDDGYDDLFVGAPFWLNTGPDQGAVYLFLGSASGLPAVHDWWGAMVFVNQRRGHSVAGRCDVNGDGVDDLLDGAPGYPEITYTGPAGAVSVWYGASGTIPGSLGWLHAETVIGSEWGFSVACAGDVDNDGIDDVIAGGWTYTGPGGAGAGVVRVFRGANPDPILPALWTLEGTQPAENLGWSVTGLGDIDNDGFDDIAVGAGGYDGVAGANSGRVTVHLGSAGGPGASVWQVEGESTNGQYGANVKSAGDVNADGFPDLYVGANLEAAFRGKAYIYLGDGTTFSATPDWTFTGGISDVGLGDSGGGGGDFDGDGVDDLVIGAGAADWAGNNTGRVRVFLATAVAIPSATQLQLSPTSTTAVAGTCSSVIQVERADGSGTPVAPVAPLVVSLSSSHGTTLFYADPSCAVPVTQVTIASSASSVDLYFRDTRAGTFDLTASSGALTDAVETQTVDPGPADLFVVSGVSNPVPAGASTEVTVEARDIYDNRATGFLGIVIFSGSDPLATYAPPTTFGAGDAGLKVISRGPVFGTVGTQTVTVTSQIAPALTGSQTGIQVLPGPPDTVTFSGTTTAVAGGTLQIDLQVVDAYGNDVAGLQTLDASLTGSATAAFFDGSFGGPFGTQSLSGSTTGNGAGWVTVTDLMAGTVNLCVDHATLVTPACLLLTFTAGAADHLALTAPATGAAGQDLPVDLQMVDASGNPVAGVFSICLDLVPITSGAFTAVNLGAPVANGPNGICGSTDAGGAASVTVRETGAGALVITSLSSGLPGSGVSDEGATIDLLPGPADHLRLTPSVGAQLSCANERVIIELVDVFGNLASIPTGLGGALPVSFQASAVQGLAQVRNTDLQNASALPADTLSAEYVGPGYVEVSLRGQGDLDLAWTAADLPVTTGNILASTFTADTVPDVYLSNIDAAPAQIVAFTGRATVTVTPLEGCGQSIGPGHLVDLVLSYGQHTPVVDVGDGTYTAEFFTGAGECPVAPATIGATVDGISLVPTVDVQVDCLNLDPSIPVLTPSGTSGEACLSLGEHLHLEVVPRDDQGTALAPGRAVTIDEVPPFLLQGSTTETVDPVTGESTYTLEVGANRCGPAQSVVVRVDGVALDTRPSLTFTCPAVLSDGVRFSAPVTAQAGSPTPAVVDLHLSDRCGTPAFGRSVVLTVKNASDLGTTVLATPVISTDDLGGTDDGRARFELTAQQSGAAELEFDVEGLTVAAPSDQVTFLLPGVVALESSFRPTSAVEGQVVELRLELRSDYPGQLRDLVIWPRENGLELVSVDAPGSLQPEARAIEVAAFDPAEPLILTVQVLVKVGAGQLAAVEPGVRYHGQHLTVPTYQVYEREELRIIERGSSSVGGCECGSAASVDRGSGLLVAAFGLSLLALRRRRRPF